MYIKDVTITNFRPYHGINTVDLTPTPDANIVLLGGKTGHGKTSFLTAVIWAIYGNLIDRVDNKFLGANRRAGYYSVFCKDSLNNMAREEGRDMFSVSVSINDIQLPDTISNNADHMGDCIITRTYNVQTAEEKLSIKLNNSTKRFLDEEDKINFINDYVIPIEAAKFVFFDAEQLVNLAALNTQDEGGFMNDALNKILGLDIYQSLLDDLSEHANDLRKESAGVKDQETINLNNNAVLVSKNNIENKREQINQLHDEQQKLQEEINDYERALFASNYNPFSDIDQQQLEERRKQVDKARQNAQQYLGRMSEMIPLCIGAGQIQEVVRHLNKQADGQNRISINVLETCLDLVGGLFYQPQFPTNDINNTQKFFYIQKAQKLFSETFPQVAEQAEETLSFEHDITKTDREFINSIYQQLLNQSAEPFRAAFDEVARTAKELQQIDNQIKKQQADSVDETVIEWATKKTDSERRLKELVGKEGSLRTEIGQEEKRITESERANSLLLNKVQIAQESKEKLERLTDYINAVERFLQEEKQQKCESLATSILAELDQLLGRQANVIERLIHKVEVNVLPNRGGLSVKLYDEIGKLFPKTNLSEGQKQIYVSCLIKAILSEAVQEYPIFIDTPLGRLDQEHINNILQRYYPNLARQVVILPQDNEIPPSRYAAIRDKVAKTYLLSVKNRNTTFQPGYFQSV